MSDIPSELSGGSGSIAGNQAFDGMDDFPVDVCISHTTGAGRFKLHFRSSKALVETLIAWMGQGQANIWLTWGTTPPDARERVESTLARASVRYVISPAASAGPPPSRAKLLLTAIVGVIGFAGLLFLLTQKLNVASEGVKKAADEQRERDDQNRRMVDRSLEGARVRTFRELEDADPAVRLQAVALVGQMYSADPQAVPAMIKRFKDGDRRVRVAAIVVLGMTRSKSQEAAQALMDCIADEDEEIRKAAQDALAKLK